MKTQNQTLMALVLLISFLLTAVPAESAQLLLSPELIVSEEYNDNIYLTPDNEVDDFITTAGLGLTGQIIGRTAGLELNYTPTYHAFADNSDLDFWRHAARLLVYKQLARNTRLELTNDYLETEDPLDESADFAPDDPTEGPGIDADRLRRGRNRYRTYNGALSLAHQFGARDSIDLSLRYRLREDIDTVAGVPVDDYTELSPLLGFEYWFTQRWGIETEGYYSNREYDDENDREEYTGYVRLLHAFNRELSGYLEYRHTQLDFDRDYDPDADIDYQIHVPSVGIRYEFEENAHFTLSVGYLFQDLEDAPDEDDYGWLVNSEIAKRWPFRTSYLELIASSGYQIEDTGVADLGLNIYYAGRATYGYNFTPRTSAEVYGGYRYDEYPDEEPERVDQTMDAGAAIRYQAFQWMNLELSYRYRDLSSDTEADEYTENRVLFRIVIAPATPYRLN